jgi:hypothetical protein
VLQVKEEVRSADRPTTVIVMSRLLRSGHGSERHAAPPW